MIVLSCYRHRQLVYEIETDNAYEDFQKYKSLLDFSDYPEDSKFFGPANKK